MLSMEQPRLFESFPNASADSNPFAAAAQSISERQKIFTQPYVRPALVVAGVVYLAICFCCIALVLLPFFQGPESSAKHNWIVKRHYSEHYKTPYLILNTGLVLAVNHLISSVLFLSFIFFYYRSLDRQTSVELYGYTWLEARWFNGHVAFFTQALTTWYNRGTVLSTRRSKRRGASPLVFNILLIGFPSIVGAIGLLLTIRETNAFLKQADTFDLLSRKLTTAGDIWKSGRNLSVTQIEFLESDFARFLRRSVQKLESIYLMNLFWTSVGIPTIVLQTFLHSTRHLLQLYVFGALSMLQTIKAHINAVKPESVLESFNNKVVQKDDFRGSFSSPIILEENSSSTLSRSFKYLCGHYFVMALVITFDVGVGMAYYLQISENAPNQSQQPIFLVLGLSGSVLLLLAMLILLIRMILEGNEVETDAIPNARSKPARD